MSERRKDYDTGYPRVRYLPVGSGQARLNVPLARVLFERAQDGYVNPTGGKTTGRERKDGAGDA